ncbi:MAG: SAM-dependent methyltransferase [Rhodospirillaceae bacterium]|nr:SAM-dependent methyltransferase [Rhodospirillaceae bacterium]|tara:strand:+ start:29971 stop:30636 length:666 start_codon:yes stop_codon:yes gene_type:complete
MSYIDFVGILHNKTKRDYIERVVSHDKAECAKIASKFSFDYWDGERSFGFGGYKYDGRWSVVAKAMIDHYKLNKESKILDVGCGKGFLIYEFTKLIPGITVNGLDISDYAVNNSKEEIRENILLGSAGDKFPWEDNSFDLVISINTLHNLYNYDLYNAIKEINRVSSKNSHITIESYRGEREKVNLLYWQLTCRSFMKPEEWEWVFSEYGYKGDYGCIFFE